jgi:hypothetical protein
MIGVNFSSIDKTVTVTSSLSVENWSKAARKRIKSDTCSSSYVIVWCLIKHRDNITSAVACPHCVWEFLFTTRRGRPEEEAQNVLSSNILI